MGVEPAPGAAGRHTLLWPLEIPGILLSSFGEYRYDHLHAGIDISTSGATGYKVFAADGGEIYRLKVEWRGYGRALYLRHPGGLVTVYGHLERYEDSTLGLERMVARRQAQGGTRYPGDIYLDPPVRVRRGQLIAYSGESGVGLPHLHFEVRERDDRPLDPFAAGLRVPPDSRSPVILSLTVTAATSETLVEGSLREKAYPLFLQGGVYHSKDPVRANGPFLASARAFDPVGTEGRSGLHSIEAFLDGRLAYRLVWRSFGFDQYPQSGLIFDHRESHLGPANFAYRLYRLPGSELARADPPIRAPVGTESAPWAFDPSPGPHRLEIVAGDEAGNHARALICILSGRPGAPEVMAPDLSRRAPIRFSLDEAPGPPAHEAGAPSPHSRPGSVPGCADRGRSVEAEFWDGRKFAPAVCSMDSGTCVPRIPEPRIEATIFRIREIRDGVPGGWRLVDGGAESSPSSAIAPAVRTWPGFLDIEVDLPRPAEPRLVLASTDGSTVGRFTYRDELRWAAPLPYHHTSGTAPLEVVTEGSPGRSLARIELESHFVEVGQAIAGHLGDVTVDIPAGGRFYPGPLLIRREAIDPIPGLPAAALVAALFPDGEALNESATLTFRPDGDAEIPLGALGIYRWDPVLSRWSYEGGDPDAAKRSVNLRFRRYGRFALLRDESPPVITAVQPPDGAVLGDRSVRVTARIEEIGMGLNYDGVAFVLDGVPLEAEFDPDRGLSRVLQTRTLRPGHHYLIATATDRAGNVSKTVASSFEVR